LDFSFWCYFWQAFHTIANPLKRQLYNQYLEEPHMSIGDNETYAQWEGRQADSTPPVPALANRLLRIRGGSLILMCICFPLTLVRPSASRTPIPFTLRSHHSDY
jgi:hypothetical protein